MNYFIPKYGQALLRLICLPIFVGIVSCTPSNSTKFLSLSTASSLKIPDLKGIERIPDSEGAYTISTSLETIYGSGLKECRVPAKASPASLNRQLFVGFDDLTIKRQERFKTGQFTSEAHASLGDLDLFLLAISTRNADCIVDIVFWKENPDEFQPETIEICKKIAARVLALEEVR
jgi:hypothetical protein